MPKRSKLIYASSRDAPVSHGVSAIPTIADFLRSPPADLLKAYFASRNIALAPEPVWASKPPMLGQYLQSAFEQLDETFQQQVMTDADRVAGERKAFVEGQLDRLIDHPVVEAAITYEAATGVTEVVAAPRETRDALVRLFAGHLLSITFKANAFRFGSSRWIACASRLISRPIPRTILKA